MTTHKNCPHCLSLQIDSHWFCNHCGYDFLTGVKPSSISVEQGLALLEADAKTQLPASANSGWVAEVWVDPSWYQLQDSDDQMPFVGQPWIVSLPRQGVLIGRNKHNSVQVDIALDSDSSCSRKHAQLTMDGSYWYVEDLHSANGTYVGSVDAELPQHPIGPGKTPLQAFDRLYVGAWTRIVVRPALPQDAITLL